MLSFLIGIICILLQRPKKLTLATLNLQQGKSTLYVQVINFQAVLVLLFNQRILTEIL